MSTPWARCQNEQDLSVVNAMSAFSIQSPQINLMILAPDLLFSYMFASVDHTNGAHIISNEIYLRKPKYLGFEGHATTMNAYGLV